MQMANMAQSDGEALPSERDKANYEFTPLDDESLNRAEKTQGRFRKPGGPSNAWNMMTAVAAMLKRENKKNWRPDWINVRKATFAKKRETIDADKRGNKVQ